MNPKKIGKFLKQLRNEKGITQERLAEELGVSGRTVSRWETGSNLPDLSILVQLSEYYHVEIKEILNGERRNGSMDNELKETSIAVCAAVCFFLVMLAAAYSLLRVMSRWSAFPS